MAIRRNCMRLLEDRWSQRKFVCVGLDPIRNRFPAHLRRARTASDRADAVYSFNESIVGATRDLVCAYKPNLAFYQSLGDMGHDVLAATISMIRSDAPDVPVILDAKYGDTADTNEYYARYAYDELKADAVTVHPYMGLDSLAPFTRRKEKGVFVLCRTSNPHAEMFQQALVADARTATSHAPLSQRVAIEVAFDSDADGANRGLVMGATAPNDIALIRGVVKDRLPFLILGVGAQGGDLEAAVRAGIDARGKGIIVNASRSIIHASSSENFAQAARNEATALDRRIRDAIARKEGVR